MNKTIACLIALVLASVTAIAQQQRSSGSIPSTLAITYYCKPADRLALRDYMVHTGLHQFEKWKADRLLRDYRILFSSYLDTDTPVMSVLLDFTDSASTARWMAIEKSKPGGLSHEALSLVTSSQTAQMDNIFHGASSPPAPPGEGIWLVIPYELYVSAPEYKQYMKDYGVPAVRRLAAGERPLVIRRVSKPLLCIEAVGQLNSVSVPQCRAVRQPRSRDGKSPR
jgi:hypothetical protein